MLKRESSKMSAAGHTGGGTIAHHVLPLRVYFTVFAALLVFTVLTVGVSVLALPEPWAIIVAMTVAVIKALLVAMFFMHLKYDDRFYWVIAGVSVLFLALFFSLTLVDLSTRGLIIEEQENGYMQKYDPNAKQPEPAKAAEPAGEAKPAEGEKK